MTLSIVPVGLSNAPEASPPLFDPRLAPGRPMSESNEDRSTLREAFDQFVGQTFFTQLLGSMRKTVGEPAYFHGGRAEEVFQGQLDQVLAERMTEASADQFTGPMFELFKLNTLSRR